MLTSIPLNNEPVAPFDWANRVRCFVVQEIIALLQKVTPEVRIK